jgi:hypothetical protein
MWPDAASNADNIAWVRDYYEATAPHSEEGGYVNFMADDDRDRVRANYGGNYDRLVEIKRRYDPDHLFHLNQNLLPAASPAAPLRSQRPRGPSAQNVNPAASPAAPLRSQRPREPSAQNIEP